MTVRRTGDASSGGPLAEAGRAGVATTGGAADDDSRQSGLETAASDRLLPDFRVDLRRYLLQQQLAPAAAETGGLLGALRAGESIPIAVEPGDTQASVLRRTYGEYARRAGLSSAGQEQFVEQMMRTGGERILHAGTGSAFTDEEFAGRKALGTINMRPTEGQVAELRRMRLEELLSYGVFDWAVTGGEERQVLDILRSDPNLSQTVRRLSDRDYLGALIDRVDAVENRRELITLLGRGLDAETARLVEPELERLDVSSTPQGMGGSPVMQDEVSENIWQVRFNLARLGVTQTATPFDRAAYSDLVSGNPSAPFTGSGATGVNPSGLSVPLGDQLRLLYEKKVLDGVQGTERRYGNPVGGLETYLNSLTAGQRRRQVEALVGQPVSTTMPELYGGELPSRAAVIRAAAARYNLEPELVTAFILAEARDQSQREDAADYTATVSIVQHDGSIGLGQVLPSTARRFDLFADMMSERTRRNLTHNDAARLLASDEVNIFATARYIRQIADEGARADINRLPSTRAIFPGLDLSAYARNSSEWPESNIRALGSEYTSRPWDDRISGWEVFVFRAYEDAKSSGVFQR